MSFSQDIRSSGNFQELFGKLRRRVNKNEVSKDDYASLQRHVNNLRTQIDWAKLVHITDNLESNPIGPNDAVFEPDLVEVVMYQPFANVFGNGVKLDKTLNSVDYDVIDIGDSTLITSTITYDSGEYHYEPYGTFNGIDEYDGTGDSASLDLNQFSVACWFRTSHDYSTNDAMLVNKGGIGSDTAGQNMNYGIWFTSDTDNKVTAGFEEGTGTDHFVVSDNILNDYLWHHAVVTYDGANVKLYIDGVLNDTHATSATPETNTQSLAIAVNSRNFSRFFQGDIDEVYIWNNDLTSGEVTALYGAGTVPQTGAIVYSNTFGGSASPTTGTKKCYYAVLDGTGSWDWNIGFHPPSMKNENSIPLNIGTTANQQFIYYEDFGTDFDFTTNNLSFGFWIYLTALPSTTNKTIMVRRIDTNNSIRIEIDDTDDKLFGRLTIGGTSSTRQYDTALTINNWYYISGTCSFSGPTLSLKVNNNADTSSAKTPGSSPSDANLYFGGYGGQTVTRFFEGYLAFPMWYKHSTVLTTTERTSLYNYNTRTDTTEPALAGFAQAG